MKSGKLMLVLAGLISLGLSTTAGWAIRAVGLVITGAITASPTSDQIEIGHHVYHIKANSPAAAGARDFYLGQVVDVALDEPAAGAQAEVVSIEMHSHSD